MGSKTKQVSIFLFVVLVVVFIFVIKYTAHNPSSYVTQIKEGYTGVVVDKYFQKTTHIKVKLNSNETIDIALLSNKMIELVAVGDTIEKIPNDNYVILHKKDQQLKVLYKHIPKSMNDDPRWPPEWKDKWNDD